MPIKKVANRHTAGLGKPPLEGAHMSGHAYWITRITKRSATGVHKIVVRAVSPDGALASGAAAVRIT
jgi:hypothetical protein